jgi:hypothetical protein
MAALTTAQQQTYIYRDTKQQISRMTLYLLDDAGGIGSAGNGAYLANDLVGVSDSATVLNHDGATSEIRAKGPYTTDAQTWIAATAAAYTTVADKAVFYFVDAANRVHKYTVACPKPSIFLADNRTVDFTNAAVKQLVADFLNITFSGTAPRGDSPVTNASGIPLVASVAGTRVSTKTPKRFNIFTRNPTLTGQGL